MLIFRLVSFGLLPFLTSLVVSLPVAEDTRILKFAGDDLGSDDLSTHEASRSSIRPSIIKVDGTTSSSASRPIDNVSPIASEVGPLSAAFRGSLELKRDNMRKYENPQPWRYEDYRAIYLEGLARTAREGGSKLRRKIYSSHLELGFPSAKAISAAKRESVDKSGVPSAKDSNESSSGTDRWGLTQEDYQQFYTHNLNGNYPQWTVEDWQSFMDRYLEFVASGGQVGKGDRKRGDAWKYNTHLDDGKAGYSSEDWHILREWMKQNGYPKQHVPYQSSSHHKRDKVDQYHHSMIDEDGRGGTEVTSITRWDSILDLEVWARRHGHVHKQKRSEDTEEAQEVSSWPRNAELRGAQDLLAQQTSSLVQQPSILPASDRSHQDQSSVPHHNKSASNDAIVIAGQGLQYLYKLCLSKTQMLGNEMEKLYRKSYRLQSSKQLFQKRDDIRKYKADITETEWARLCATSTSANAIRLLEEANTSKNKREVNYFAGDDDGFEQLTAKDIVKLHEIAMADPKFLEFQRQYLAEKVQKRRPIPPGTHHTAPVHEGTAPAGDNDMTAGSDTSSSDSSEVGETSSRSLPSEAKIKPRWKRDNVLLDEHLGRREDIENRELNDEIIPERRATMLFKHNDLQQRSQTGPIPAPNADVGRSIAKVMAAEDTLDQGKGDLDQEKRDNMYKYPGGLDDYDDWFLDNLFCHEEFCPRGERDASSLTQKRDSIDKYESSPGEWESYSELLKAMEDGRLPSFYPRAHSRDLSNFPSWAPSENPAPPKTRPEASSKKEKRKFGARLRDLSNFPSWMPSENPAPPKNGEGIGSSKKAKRDTIGQDGENGDFQSSIASQWDMTPFSRDGLSRTKLPKSSLVEALDEDGHVTNGKRDKVDQYDRNMTNEDEWIDIYRLYYIQRQRERHHSSNVNGKRQQRRAPRPEPKPEPDTVVVQPVQMGLTQLAQPTTIHGGGVGSSTSLLSMSGASPGPGVSSIQAPAAALSPSSGPPPNPSAIFNPFGPLLPLGPSRTNVPVASDRRRREADVDAPNLKRESIGSVLRKLAERNGVDQSLVRQHEEIAGRVPAIEQRAPKSTSTSMSNAVMEAISAESQTQAASPTKLQYPEGAAPLQGIPVNLGDVLQDFGPLLDIALPTTSPSSQYPLAGTTESTNATGSNHTKRDSIEHYSPTHSVQEFSDEEWDNFDNYITFQEAEGPPVKRKLASFCVLVEAKPSNRVLEPGCRCKGITRILPVVRGPDPCAYPSLPKSRNKRDDATKYNSDKVDTRDLYQRYSQDRSTINNLGGLKEERDSTTSESQPQPQSTLQPQSPSSSSSSSSSSSYDSTQEQTQQEEGLEQAKTEEGGSKTKNRRNDRNDRSRRRRWQWVPEEEELIEGMPEGSEHDKAKKRMRRWQWVPEEEELIEDMPEGSVHDKVKAKEKRVRLPSTTEGGVVGDYEAGGRKRHCGRAEEEGKGLPEGYGSNETATICR